jgi:AcrR family transcriptional regulator
VTTPTRGRPRTFDRDHALLEAARLFWRHGYSGTSTRALSAALGVSQSSLYAAFGTKAELFEEAVRTYAGRYRTIYADAVAEPTFAAVLERVLDESVVEFTQPPEQHPGCLVSSAVVADGPDTIDVRDHIARLHDELARMLEQRVARAVAEGELRPDTDPGTVADLVQAVWHGLSADSNREVGRERLLATGRLARRLLLDGLATDPATTPRPAA